VGMSLMDDFQNENLSKRQNYTLQSQLS
jgi:hypothetical protein